MSYRDSDAYAEGVIKQQVEQGNIYDARQIDEQMSALENQLTAAEQKIADQQHHIQELKDVIANGRAANSDQALKIDEQRLIIEKLREGKNA